MIFKYKVDKKQAFDYYFKIKNPICLEDIKAKTKRQNYGSIHDFRSDIELLRHNAELYNGFEHWISKIARDIEQHALTQLNDNQEELQVAEAAAMI